MGLERGFNKPHNEGVYVCGNDFVWEFKVFHENIKMPTYLIARELKTNETFGPFNIVDGSQEEVGRALELKSWNLMGKLASK